MDNTTKAKMWIARQAVSLQYDASDGFTTEDITEILECRVDEIRQKITRWNFCTIDSMVQEVKHRAMERWSVSMWDVRHVYPEIDLNLETLARQTKSFIGVELEIKHLHRAEYIDASLELDALGINPNDVHHEWPEIDGRDPLISTVDLLDVWNNCYYSGQWVALLDGRDVLTKAIQGKLDDISTLKAGSNITVYDFWNGSGSVIVKTIRDYKINPAWIYNDAALKYGIQSCYGLDTRTWNGIVE